MTPDEQLDSLRERRLDDALAALPKHDMSEMVAQRILAAAEKTEARIRRRPDWGAVAQHGMAFAAAVLLLLLLPLTIALGNRSGPSDEVTLLEIPSKGNARLMIPWQRGGSFMSAADAPIAQIGFNLGDGAAARAQALRGERHDAFALYNAFGYQAIGGAAAVAVASEVAECPWAPAHRLLRVQIETRRALASAAIQLELDPANVASYRLVGGDASARSTAPAAQPVHAGTRIVALFEIALRPDARGDLGTLVVSGDAPTELALHDAPTPLAQASTDFRFSAALAELAQDGALVSDAVTLATSASAAHPDRLASSRRFRNGASNRSALLRTRAQ